MNSPNIFKIPFVGVIAGLALLASAGTAGAAGPWYVSAATGNNANDCLSPVTACKTIQAAIDKATAGDTIVVAAGIYGEHVSINKALTINGANSAVACRAARGTESVITGNASGAVQILADNVTFNGFQVSSVSNALNSGIWMDASRTGALIKNNLISQNQIGVYANNAGASTINCNIFDGNNETGPVSGAGIYSENTASLTIDNNEFKNHLVNNPVIFGATAASVHDNLVFSNNILLNAFGIVVIGVDVGSFTGNDVDTDDATGLSFDGADANVSVIGNLFHDGWHAVRVRDAGYLLGLNSNILVNRNSILNHSDYGIGNEGPSGIAELDASCNWWGDASGPGPVGSGTGDGVTTLVDFTPWLTTSDLVGDPCAGGAPAPQVTVKIIKYVSGVHATAGNANSAAFPMLTTFDSTNLGSATDAPFTLDPAGWSGDPAYEASFANSDSGADYATHEDTSTAVVGPNCASGQQFQLSGYTTGDSLAAAQAGSVSSTSPAFTNITTNKWVIVWNAPCAPVPPPPAAPPANACSLGSVPGYTVQNGTSGSDVVTLTPNTMFKGNGGHDQVSGGDGNYIVCTGSGSDTINLGNGDSTIDAGSGSNSVTVGNGTGYITTGSGNDTISAGNGARTINAGSGTNSVTTGSGDQTITTGSGNDTISTVDGAHTINAGTGTNSVTTGSGNQTITTGNGNDTISTGSGNDTISAGSGTNVVNAGAGNDSVTTGSGNDSIDGGPDIDSCSAGSGTNSVVNCSP